MFKRLFYLIPIAIIALTTGIITPSQNLALTDSQIATKGESFTVIIDGPEAEDGSGVIIEKNNNTYTVITNWHVVNTQGEYIIVTPDKKKYKVPYNKVKQLPGYDLAILQFTANIKYTTAKIGSSTKLKLGDKVYIGGFPHATSDTEKGYIFIDTSVRQLLTKAKDGYTLAYNQAGASGTSGGALLDDNGDLVGINGESTPDSNSRTIFGRGIPIDIFVKNKNRFISPGGVSKKTTNPPSNILSYVFSQKFDDARDFNEGIGGVNIGNKWGYINQNGEQITSLKFNDVGDFNEGVARVKIGNKWGYIDKNGEKITVVKFDIARDFNDGLARVKMGNKWGYINTNGQQIIPLKFDEALRFNDNLAPVRIGSKWGYINKNGQQIIDFKFDEARYFSDNLAPVKMGNKWGYIDKSGQQIIGLKFDDAFAFNEGLARVRIGNKWGYIDSNGEKITPIKFDDSAAFNQGFAAVKNGNKWGYIDKSGQQIIDFKFDDAWNFNEGLAAVKMGNKWGYINQNGQQIINFKFDQAGDFKEGFARVKMGKKWGYIRFTGRG